MNDLNLQDLSIGYVVLIGIFIASLTSANLLAAKIAFLGSLEGVPLFVPAGVVAYAVTFTTTDIISEVYGKRASEKVVRAGFITQLIVLFYGWSAIALPAAPFMKDLESAFNSLIASPPNVIVASLTAYLISQHHDVWAFHFWRNITAGRWLWLRNNASTLVSQAIDTTVFITLAFGALPAFLSGTVVPWKLIPNTILGQYIVKVSIALADTPFVYLGVYLLRGGKP